MWRLLGFAVGQDFALVFAKFLQNQSIGGVFGIFIGSVVTLMATFALKGDERAISLRHVTLLLWE